MPRGSDLADLAGNIGNGGRKLDRFKPLEGVKMRPGEIVRCEVCAATVTVANDFRVKQDLLE